MSILEQSKPNLIYLISVTVNQDKTEPSQPGIENFLTISYNNIEMDKAKLTEEIKGNLLKKFPDLIDGVILYGSQIRGKGSECSDYDILVVLKDDYSWSIENEIHDLCYEIDLKYEILTDVKIISQDELNTIKGKQPSFISQFNIELIYK